MMNTISLSFGIRKFERMCLQNLLKKLSKYCIIKKHVQVHGGVLGFDIILEG